MSLRAWRYGWRYGVGLKRRKASQTRRLARLETADFVMFLVAGAGFEPAEGILNIYLTK
jgi:hypothetical protein